MEKEKTNVKTVVTNEKSFSHLPEKQFVVNV